MNENIDAERAFAHALQTYDRIAIAGGPKTGKTTLAAAVTDRPVIHTDDHKGMQWSELPPTILALPDLMLERWVIEGVQVGRCLRKGLKPDLVLWLDGAWEQLSPGLRSMEKGCETIFKDWLRNYRPEGVDVHLLGAEGRRSRLEGGPR